MESVAISIQNISKKFRLFNCPKERLLEALHPFNKKYHREFWALKDINFEVTKGMTLGIIGRNGSGKSTLLQVLCSVLKPTSGTATVNGKISALLELGAGFNPEFTGRHNVMMNGILRGFSREEMKKRMPIIEDFADIGEFIDQPMKIYSSGMSVRLAFAAAINVDPDILVIDEALAVGDAKFQHKCFRKFHELQEMGKTIVLVTHNMEAITRHCDQAILLDYGRIVKNGAPNEIANLYLSILLGDSGKPKLVKSIGGYNIVALYEIYYAVPLSLGVLDLTKTEALALPGILKAQTLEEIESFIKIPHLTPKYAKPTLISRENPELENFLEEIPETDSCVNRKSYNKDEFRQGDRRAEILDYLLICENKPDPVEIKTFDKLDIYIKAVFHEQVQFPLYGFAIKTLDGIRICGTNTWLDGVSISPTDRSDIVIFKFSIRMLLAGGDFFITLAVAERVNDEYVLIDHRADLVHLFVRQKKEGFNGFVEMETENKMISHRKR